MVFDYYHRLNQRQKQIYRQSDRVDVVDLPDPAALRSAVRSLSLALQDDDRKEVLRLSSLILNGIAEQLNVPRVTVTVLAKRPSSDWGELHGLYEPADGRKSARITVWMRTAKRRKVVAFRTFLRTLLHELCHHLDYEHYAFHDSFHTEGFYKRESGLFEDLVEPEPESEQKTFDF